MGIDHGPNFLEGGERYGGGGEEGDGGGTGEGTGLVRIGGAEEGCVVGLICRQRRWTVNNDGGPQDSFRAHNTVSVDK